MSDSSASGAGVRVQVTERDELMLSWLREVRLADVDSLRFALGALSGSGVPVGVRAAQLWVKRMVEAGLLDRGRPAFRDASVVWAAPAFTGRAAPNPYRATARHDVGVAAVSARFLLAGYGWRADALAGVKDAHVVDGVALSDGPGDFVEVELTAKSAERYSDIRNKFTWRISRENVGRIFYFGTPSAIRAVRTHLLSERYLVDEDRRRFVLVESFDERGKWQGDWEAPALGKDFLTMGES